ncbi:hypothetical protein [Paramuribaculum intestinale]|jgi:uncharacterized membrane protein YeaQ/YmgE (transglycosylase-associated protein family)|uniref:hypothetical protein n=2 Tax=Paramuribaculum intestinale TaxID=2094151 RepID=UPI000F46CBD5|nr:hypothetical protein [Paramuribaculum intestinale]ROT16443.1 hypothetical protein EEL50_04360 [Muribaculaceae bacterium Isolate-105 (HZI)]RXE62958.1 hypothetical protein ED375_02965 [Muribaculaceae bacterium Isolate-004 (NCI)]
MILAGIGLTTWLVWALIGAVGGYMCGRLLTSGGVSAAVNVAVGIASAIGGGYAFIRWFGENDYGQTISLCGAVVVCAVVLWCLSFIFRRNGGDS